MNVLVSGALGRMGKEVISCIEANSDLTLVCGFNQFAGSIRRNSSL